jgi:hypothetical protein
MNRTITNLDRTQYINRIIDVCLYHLIKNKHFKIINIKNMEYKVKNRYFIGEVEKQGNNYVFMVLIGDKKVSGDFRSFIYKCDREMQTLCDREEIINRVVKFFNKECNDLSLNFKNLHLKCIN